jgi:hypothetical protein
VKRNESPTNVFVLTLVVFACAYATDQINTDPLETARTPPMNRAAVEEFKESCKVSNEEGSCIIHQKGSGKLWKISVVPGRDNGTVMVLDRDGYTQGKPLAVFVKSPGGKIITSSDDSWNFYHQAFLQGVQISYR